MKCNMGKTDKTVRLVLGSAIVAAGLYFQNWLGLIGLIPIGTAILGICPAYIPFGISTCEKKV